MTEIEKEVLRAYSYGYSIETIMEYTGLTEDEVKTLIEKYEDKVNEDA